VHSNVAGEWLELENATSLPRNADVAPRGTAWKQGNAELASTVATLQDPAIRWTRRQVGVTGVCVRVAGV
jgi:hypothetical protein